LHQIACATQAAVDITYSMVAHYYQVYKSTPEKIYSVFILQLRLCVCHSDT